MKQFRIRKDDKVMVIAGKDQGKIGKVLKVLNGYECIRSYFFCRLFLTASRKAQREQGDGNACR